MGSILDIETGNTFSFRSQFEIRLDVLTLIVRNTTWELMTETLYTMDVSSVICIRFLSVKSIDMYYVF